MQFRRNKANTAVQFLCYDGYSPETKRARVLYLGHYATEDLFVHWTEGRKTPEREADLEAHLVVVRAERDAMVFDAAVKAVCDAAGLASAGRGDFAVAISSCASSGGIDQLLAGLALINKALVEAGFSAARLKRALK